MAFLYHLMYVSLPKSTYDEDMALFIGNQIYDALK